jgi:hypothetical protein
MAFTSIFQKMMERDQMVKGDAEVIALEFISPITIMVQLLDREPMKKTEALHIIEKHIDIFLERYNFN